MFFSILLGIVHIQLEEPCFLLPIPNIFSIWSKIWCTNMRFIINGDSGGGGSGGGCRTLGRTHRLAVGYIAMLSGGCRTLGRMRIVAVAVP